MTLAIPPRTTLGAHQPGTSYWSVGDAAVDPPYWLGCLTRSEAEKEPDAASDMPIPHVYFITTAEAARVFCDACQPPRIARPKPTPAQAAPTPTAPSGPPWGSGEPVWHVQQRPALLEWWEERAAIIEYEAGLDRHAAEHAAYQLLLKGLAT